MNDICDIIRAQKGDTAAFDTLYSQNEGLIRAICKHFLGRCNEYDDLYQVGCLGFVKAVLGFNTDLQIQFSTYAFPVISGEIKKYIRDNTSLHISRSVKERAVNVYRVSDILRTKLGRSPTISELSTELLIEPELIIEAMEAMRPPISLDAPLSDDLDNEQCTLGDLIPDNDSEIEEKVISDSILKELISSLSPKDRQIIISRYFAGETQSEVASKLGISQSQLSRIEAKIIKTLKMKYA